MSKSKVYSDEEFDRLVKESTVPEICLENSFVHEDNLRLSAYNIPMTEESRVILIRKINDIFDNYFKS